MRAAVPAPAACGSGHDGGRMNIGVVCALGGAALFGASTPIAKLLVGEIAPVMLAGLLYAGSGLGLIVWDALRRAAVPGAARAAIGRADYKWLAGAVIMGGIIGPVLLMIGLAATQASAASLLLNLEGVFTALLAWFAFRENFDRRVMLGMFLIVCGGVVLAWQPGDFALSWPALAITGACVCWAVDNNLTRKISAGDAVRIAAIKGLVAGTVNLSLSMALGFVLPGLRVAAAAMGVGLLGYGISLVLFVVALRNLGTARTGAYFSTAPFIGAALSFAVFGDAPDALFWIAAVLMAAGVILHLTERHQHAHKHQAGAHTHAHVHDDHHRHEHKFSWNGAEPHTHPHDHETLTHGHPHYPDIHHRHSH
jgi:drug/metabolite transporter (DMT)-like permease